jgi:predicted GIY-YIG superfamily endonuclease
MVYLLHFERPMAHARHYIGFTDNLQLRIKRHRSGQSAMIVRAFHERGISFVVARTWEEGREFERHLKMVTKNAPRLCPICRAERTAGMPYPGSGTGEE